MESLMVNPDVDFSQALPIQQKRIVAFVNHFIMTTVSFLDNFTLSCESRFMEFEFKLQKVDASLKILESQLSSIPEESLMTNLERESHPSEDTDVLINPEEKSNSSSQPYVLQVQENPQYSKYFKMVQVGVPKAAVKLKMANEGLDPSILDI